MGKYKCCFCGETVEQSEAQIWGHIQLCHPMRFEAMHGLGTPAMVEECYLPEDALHERKTPLVTPAFVCEMIADLSRAGLRTENGDRKSRYFPIAMGRNEKSAQRVEAALIEEAAGIPENEAGYSIHVVNDVDGSDCQVFHTDHLDGGEAVTLFGDILNKLADGRL